MTVILEATDVFRFHEVEGDRVPILRGVSLRLEKGTFTTIMGPSGSGKSTLLHILAGLDTPSSGDVRLGDQSLAKADEETRTRLRRESIGFIFQFFNLLPDLTVEENIELPLLIAGAKPAAHRERRDELIEVLGLGAVRRRLPNGLSGGEMQRVSIARALINDPPLLLCDEPTGNLSSKAGEDTIRLLRAVAERYGSTVLLVTHNHRDAAAGDTVLFLHDGEMAADTSLTGGGFDATDVLRRLEELGI